jgi:hypothetical protein
MANLKIIKGDGEVGEVNKNLYEILKKSFRHQMQNLV